MDDPFDMTPPTGMYSLEVLNAALMRISSQRSEEHTSELQSQSNLVCRLLLEKKQPLDLHARGRLPERLVHPGQQNRESARRFHRVSGIRHGASIRECIRYQLPGSPRR